MLIPSPVFWRGAAGHGVFRIGPFFEHFRTIGKTTGGDDNAVKRLGDDDLPRLVLRLDAHDPLVPDDQLLARRPPSEP